MRFENLVAINPKVPIKRGSEYPCVMMEDITPGNRYVTASKIKTYKGGSVFQDGDVLFARITPCLENGKIAQYRGASGFGSTEFFIFRHKEGISDPGYIYYLSQTEIIRKPAEKSMYGASGRQRADLASLVDLDISIPPLPTQRKIAAILSAYDDLIENNTRRIRILEEMAQTIYQEWFVKFHFPGHEGVKMEDSPLGLIPEGWEVVSIGQAFNIIGGSTPSTKVPEYWENGDIIWFSPSDLTATKSMFISDSEKKINKVGLKNSSAKIFPAYCVMMTSRATIGVVAINTKPACTNQGFITCVPNERLTMYQIYFWILSNKEKIDNVASGATYKEINRTEFREFLITVPDIRVTNQFTQIITHIGKEIEILLEKNINLRRTRDLLLPKLISGEVDVETLAFETLVNKS